MRDILRTSFRLLLITVVAGLALGVTNAVTKDPIEAQAIAAADSARRSVLPDAVEFKDVNDYMSDVALIESIDNAYVGLKDGMPVGFTAQTTVRGYGGDIEIIVGMSMDGAITGVSIGGSNFSETPGLGAKAMDEDWSGQFKGIAPEELDGHEITLNEDVDAITAATITSQAVTDGINAACRFIFDLIGGVAQ